MRPMRTVLRTGIVALLAACTTERALAPEAHDAALATAGTPSGLSASAASDVQIDLSWQDRSPNESGFEVHRSTTGATGTFTLLSTTAANVSSQRDLGLTTLTEYCYRVRMVRIRGGKPAYSDFSNTACASTLGRPATPSGVTTSLWVNYYEGSTFVVVAWSPSPNATGYRVQRSTNGVDPWELIATTTGTSSYDPVRQRETLLCYRVAAFNAYGESSPSVLDCTGVPAAATDLVATSSDATSIDLAWVDNSAFEDGYEIQRAREDGVFSVIGTVGENVTRYYDATVSSDTRYWYRVRAMKDGGYSIASNDAGGLATSTRPGAPTNLQVIPASSNSIWVGWTDGSTNEQGFRLERSTDGGSTWAIARTTIWGDSRQSLTDTARTPDEQVLYRVFAFNGVGDSPPSATDFTVPPKGPANLAVSGATADAIDLTWSDESGVEDGYEVQSQHCDYTDYYHDGSDYYCYWVTEAALPAGTSSWRATGLDASSYYTYQVLAFKDNGGLRGYSDASNVVQAMTQP